MCLYVRCHWRARVMLRGRFRRCVPRSLRSCSCHLSRTSDTTVTKIWVHSPFWSVGNIRTNTTVRKSDISTSYVLRFSDTFPIFAQVKQTQCDSISSIVLAWKQFNSIRQRTNNDDSQLQTCSQTLPSPPQASSPPPNVHRHPNRLSLPSYATPTPSPPNRVRRPQSFLPQPRHRPLPGPPTSRISLHRRDQLRTFTTYVWKEPVFNRQTTRTHYQWKN